MAKSTKLPKPGKKTDASTLVEGATATATAEPQEGKAKTKTKPPKVVKNSAEAMDLPIGEIQVCEGHNPRQAFGTDSQTAELAENIKRNGLIHPLLLRGVRGEADTATYWVISGERRLRAIKTLGWATVPVRVRWDVDADTARAIAVAENNEELSMKLNGIELARIFQDLRDKDWTVPKISNLTGVHERRVQRCLELLDAPQEVQDAVSAGKIAESVAREVASASDNVRGAILNALEHSPNMSAMDIRKLAKAQEKALHAAETGGSAPDPEGEGETEGGKGANRPAAHAATPDLVTWRGHRELQGVLVQACSTLCAPEDPNEDGKAKTAEEESEDAMARAHLLGVAAAMLFARDDIKTPWPPAPGSKEEASLLGLIKKVHEREAKKAKPKEEKKA